MISNLAGFITRREGKKFLRLEETIDESRINSQILKEGEPISLYIHIPFCRTLCPFCCFNRYLYKEDSARTYYVNLKKELDLYAEKGFTFSDLYIGGGTPTLLMDELLKFIDYAKNKFHIQEISMETTPYELNQENISSLNPLG